MKTLSETKALERLRTVQVEFADQIREGYEHRAKDCLKCDTPGACCLDSHFVNVRITRLEAVAIGKVIDELSSKERAEVVHRIEGVIKTYKLPENDFYACPLFAKGVGCLVHDRAKPLPCIAHACYERKEDLPSDDLLTDHEGLVAGLNERTYRTPVTLSSLPVALLNSMNKS
ncbi:MAG TPA: hypothetical protein VNA22_05715 [Pyrinomonadaceae bacterium]|nr:hypothetical protein [Pyrinomonadaceae bacterium]